MAENYWNSSLTGENIEATLLGAVRGDATQNKGDAWKAKARQNIGAVSLDEAGEGLNLGTAATADIDSTLAVSGAVADAKVTGDAIDELKTSWPAAWVSDTTTTFQSVSFQKVDDHNLKIYGTFNTGLRHINVFNGSNELLTSTTVPTKGFPAGKYKFHVNFTGTYEGGMRVIPNTTGSGTIAISDGDIVDVQVPFAVGIRVPASSDWGTEESPTYLHFEAEYIGAREPYAILPSGDRTDRTNDIASTLRAFGKCFLTKGEYYISGFTQPAGSLLEGCGRASILRVNPEAETSGIIMQYGSTIQNLKILGPREEGWSPDGVVTGRHGIVMNTEGDTVVNRNRLTVHNVEIAWFDGAGIYMISTGYNYDNSVNISDCYVHHNNYGLDNPKRSEYNRICNCSFANNYVGIRMNGGNNLVSNCGINGNVTGLVMDATEIAGGASNNSHGSFSNCTFNHSKDAQGNTTTAIRINGMESGEVFSACQIAYGGITVANSCGIHFADCNFLSDTPINVTGDKLTLFSDCIFTNAAASPITGGGNAVLTNCYYRSGTPRPS